MTHKATTPPLTGAELDLDNLEALARAATPGEWKVERLTGGGHHNVGIRVRGPLVSGYAAALNTRWSNEAQSAEQEANAAFIAATNPRTVLSLIAQARAQQESAAAPELSDLETYPSPHGTLVRLADVKCRISSQPPAPVVAADERAEKFALNLAAAQEYDPQSFINGAKWQAALAALPAPMCHAPAGTADAMRMWDALPDAKPAAAPEAAHADDAPMRCHCVACRDGLAHASDCAVHNEPAEANGPCNCEASAHAQQDAAPAVVHQAQVDGGSWLDIEQADIPNWEAMHFKVRALYAAPAASAPSDATGKATDLTYPVDGVVMSPVEYIDYLHQQLGAAATGKADAANAGGLTSLDYRAQGREEALAIILAESAEDPFSEYTGWRRSGAPDDEGGAYWKEDELRKLLHIGDRKHDAYDRAEAAYWAALGRKDEAEREMLFVQQAPFYRPLHDFLDKHEAWDLMGDLKRAGAVNQSPATSTADAKDAERYRQMKENDFTIEYCTYISDCLNERETVDLDTIIDRAAIAATQQAAPGNKTQSAPTAASAQGQRAPAGNAAALPSPKFASVMAIADEYGSGALAYTVEEVRALLKAPAEKADARDAERWRFSMRFQGDGSEREQPQAIIDLWRKVYAEHRLRPTRQEYEAAIDAAIAAENPDKAAAADAGSQKQAYGPDNPPRLRRPGESLQDYRVAMGWDQSKDGAA